MQPPFEADAVRHGDHLCSSYAGDAEQRDVVERFIQDGLQRNERIWYVAGAGRTADVGKRFALDPLVGSGQAVIADAARTYTDGGAFDPARMIAYYDAAIASALEDGYAGLRVAAEMDWAQPSVAGAGMADLIAYERRVTALFAGRPAAVLCQYDRRVIDPAALLDIEAAHPRTLTPPALHTSGALTIRRGYDPAGLIVSGEIDISNRAAFEGALAQLSRADEKVLRIDGSALRYLDARSMGMLIRFAAALEDERRLELHLPPVPRRMMTIVGGARAPRLQLVEVTA